MSKQQLIQRVNNLAKSKDYKDWILKIINLKTIMPNKYNIGIKVNFTIYKVVNGEKIAIAYFWVENSGVTIMDQDQTGKEMSELCYDITTNLKENLKIVNNKKVFFYHIITEQDAENVYNKILKV